MGIIKAITATAGAIIAFLLLGASGAQAAGCPSDQSVVDYKSGNPPYQCAVHNWSSKKSIASWETKSWSSDTALGYNFATKCIYRSSSEVSYTWDHYGPSYVAMFTNWATGSRHFGTGVIFTTGNYNGDQIDNSNSCATGDGKIKNSIKRITQGITLDSVQGNGGNSGSTLYFSGTVSPSSSTTGYAVLVIAGEPITSNGQPVAGPIKDGKYTIAWKTPIVPTDVTLPVSVVFPGDTSQCPAAAKTCGSTPAGPTDPVMIKLKKSYTPMPVPDSVSTSASTGVQTSSDSLIDPVVAADTEPSATVSSGKGSGIVVRESSKRMPGKLGAQCPAGTVMLHAELDAASSNRGLSYGKRGVQLKRGAVANGRKATIQLTCRQSANAPFHGKRASFGTARADRMSTRARSNLMFGGPGADRMVVRHRNAHAHGGLGNDHLVVRAAGGVVSGGSGNDTIRSRAAGRTLIIGGPGRDRIVAGGQARVNVRDGERDRVVCRGSKVRVLADSLDSLGRNCRRA